MHLHTPVGEMGTSSWVEQNGYRVHSHVHNLLQKRKRFTSFKMKKLVTLIFNGFCWFFDSLLFVAETIVTLVWALAQFVFMKVVNGGQTVQRFVKLGTWPAARPRMEESYGIRAIRILFILMLQIIFTAWVLEAFPQLGDIFAPIARFFRTLSVYFIGLISCLCLLLPQQQLFRDPVTRIFFRRGWFKNYGHASFFTKCLSFFTIIILFCNAWVN